MTCPQSPASNSERLPIITPVPKPKDRAAAQLLSDRKKSKLPFARLGVSKENGKVVIAPEHQDAALAGIMLANAFGATNAEFTNTLIGQLANIAGVGNDVTTEQLNGVVAMVHGIGPKDETEAMLAAQMVAIHNATLSAARRLKGSNTIPQQDSASTMLNKLARTFAAQIEALKKYRSTGEQSIRVQHVTVNEGGQAVVGDIATGVGGNIQNGRATS